MTDLYPATANIHGAIEIDTLPARKSARWGSISRPSRRIRKRRCRRWLK